MADPDNAALADAAFWALRQAVSTACPFTHEALHAADALLTPAQRCTVVTCVLEVGSQGWSAASGGAAAWRVARGRHEPGPEGACTAPAPAPHGLPMLFTFRRLPAPLCVLAQVSIGLVAATLLAWRTQLRVARKWAQQHAAHGAGAAAQQQLRASQYGRVAQPLMQAARACPGGMPVVCGLPAIYAFVAALVWQQRGGAAAAAGAG